MEMKEKNVEIKIDVAATTSICSPLIRVCFSYEYELCFVKFLLLNDENGLCCNSHIANNHIIHAISFVALIHSYQTNKLAK
jgi:hypothetical protein